MVGVWEYRNTWHGLVVGEYEVTSEPGSRQLSISESPSRGGHDLSGRLARRRGGWLSARLQHGYACRLWLEAPGRLRSQFALRGCPWEHAVVSSRREAGSGRSVLVLGASLSVGAAGSAVVFGPALGLGMLALLLVHEFGHVAAMWRLGLSPGPLVFVPFLGAAVEMREAPELASHEAFVALAGPGLGSIATLACMAAAFTSATPMPVALQLADFSALLNLANLMPLGLLDGGRVAPMLESWALKSLAAGSIASMYVMPQHLMVVPYAVFGSCLYADRRGLLSHGNQQSGYYETLTLEQRRVISATYVGLGVVLLCTLAVPKVLPGRCEVIS